jgi:hypothetical protein
MGLNWNSKRPCSQKIRQAADRMGASGYKIILQIADAVLPSV